ncbi:hypothetical protein DFJ74DRAFT_149635 [Hyaloraphidium curvatum]|nr:hypothetical protein DFJ74DRAFT_149635 [Hyaloraphidium curvatum]
MCRNRAEHDAGHCKGESEHVPDRLDPTPEAEHAAPAQENGAEVQAEGLASRNALLGRIWAATTAGRNVDLSAAVSEEEFLTLCMDGVPDTNGSIKRGLKPHLAKIVENWGLDKGNVLGGIISKSDPLSFVPAVLGCYGASKRRAWRNQQSRTSPACHHSSETRTSSSPPNSYKMAFPSTRKACRSISREARTKGAALGLPARCPRSSRTWTCTTRLILPLRSLPPSWATERTCRPCRTRCFPHACTSARSRTRRMPETVPSANDSFPSSQTRLRTGRTWLWVRSMPLCSRRRPRRANRKRTR